MNLPPTTGYIPAKDATHCEAAAVHVLLCKRLFNTNMSQVQGSSFWIMIGTFADSFHYA